ncbi:MAG: NAD(P)-dependent alcohol dehydrogenase [Syntrophobacteraceae bacterium]|jgi:aryl-alcohol dehydrogenase
MSIRTRAAVVSQPAGPFVFQDVELDGPRPGEALVRMVACGICHTDIAARDGLFGLDFPAVFGHEGAGIVESVGSQVVRVRPGDKVVISFGSCGKCSNCRDAHPAHCKDFERLNFGGARPDGSSAIHDTRGVGVGCCFFGQSSLAYHALAYERNLVPVDAGDNDELALFAPLGCGVQAGAGTVLNELKPRPGESFVVFGAGTVGLSALMAARMAGATPIVAVDRVRSRLELARELGATHVLDAQQDEIVPRLRELAGTVDHAVETTGVRRLIDHALRSLGPYGKMSMLGVSHEDSDDLASPKSPGPNQKVFYSIAGDSDPQKFIPYLITCYRQALFPFNMLIREYPALKINQAVRDSLDGSAVKPVLRFS